MVNELMFPVLFIVLSPILGGFLSGIDRKITARLQNRIGPPIPQPFYDVLKLWSKQPIIASNLQPIFAGAYFLFSLISLSLLAFGQDLLLIVFVVSLADVSLILGSYSVRSPYSYIGARRELIQVLACEPILILTAVGFYLTGKSFLVGDIIASTNLPILMLPGFFLAFLMTLIIEARKSPFDISASHHAHQEIVRGVFTEFSGYNLALIELGHWIKLVLFLSIIALFFTPNLLLGGLVAFLSYVLTVIIDNIFPRLTWASMIKTVWSLGLTLIALNSLFLVIMGAG